ncbi:MAG TPA: GNAT family N-acetyltransferase [Fimbriimonadaceae bacterium]|jgi:GNAT superfamily N-acetyltransferase
MVNIDYGNVKNMVDCRIEPCVNPDLITDVLCSIIPQERIQSELFARRVLLDHNFRSEGSLIIWVGSEPAGYCWALRRHVPLENAVDDSYRGYIVLFGIKEAFRRRGLGKALLDSAEKYLCKMGCKESWISPYAPGYFTPGIDVNAHPEGLRFMLNRGYESQSKPLAMEIDLEYLRVPDYVASSIDRIEREFTFTSYSPELTVPLLKFAAKEFAGDWVRFVRDAARDILKGDDPGRLQIACQGDQVVGYCHHEDGRFGPIGVSKRVEANGVGSELMRRGLLSIASSGLNRAWFLWTNEETAKRFYSPWGWKEWRRFEVVKKSLV